MKTVLIFMLLGIILNVFSKSITATTNECLITCDNENPGGISVTMCGTDFVTHETHIDTLGYEGCYMCSCAIMTYYEGSCGCPNECFSAFGHGSCAKDNTCVCSAGWGGKDCSLPHYGNKCNMHGKVVQAGDALPFDHCVCDDGWTGTDCGSQTFTGSPLPWGEVFSSDYYTKEDKYGDDHPLWNISVLASIHVTLDESDYVDLLQPWNLYNQTYAHASVSFDNGLTRETLEDVGIHIKGDSTRREQKKGWVLKFNAFTSGQKLLGVKKVGLKPGTNGDDTFIKNKLYMDMNRAIGVPTQRASYALLYINQMYVGLYYMHEEIDSDFIANRIKDDDGDGNRMKMCESVFLLYEGDDVEIYQNKTFGNCLGNFLPNYEQDGDGDWTDFVSLLSFLNSTSDVDFAAQVESRVDVTSLLKAMVVQSFLLTADAFANSGKNYLTYHLKDDKHTDKWTVLVQDFDDMFMFSHDANNIPREDPDIITYLTMVSRPSEQNLLLTRIMNVTSYRQEYEKYYSIFLEAVFGTKSPVQPGKRHTDLMQFVLPWVARDRLAQMSSGITAEKFVSYAEQTAANLQWRYMNVTAQLENLNLISKR